MLIHALNSITTPQINQLLEHTMYITSAKNVDFIIPPKNGDLPELCYPVHGVRERVNRVLDVGVHAVFLAAVVSRGPNTHSAVWVSHLV